MKFNKDVVDRAAAGEIDLAFRRWRKPEAKPGGGVRTAFGVILIDTVTEVEPSSVSEEDARRAGYRSRDDLFGDLRPGADRKLYRVGIRYGGPDPRIALSAQSDLSEAELVEIAAVLRRLDARGCRGPWTEQVLGLIARRPATRAPDLAAEIGRDPDLFKLDVRKLKNHGLTESLGTGYRISPRGERVLKYLRAETSG